MDTATWLLLMLLAALVFIDWAQTLTIAAVMSDPRQRNPVLHRVMEMFPVGRARSKAVTGYFIATSILMLFAILAAPALVGLHQDAGLIPMAIFILAELVSVVNNHLTGINDPFDLEL